MTSSFRVLIILGVVLLISLSGCASKPDEQINLAQDAMKQAVDQFADQYAPGDWKGAKEFWDQAQAQLEKQEYAAAKETLLRAKTRFLKARDVAKAERESMLVQVKDIQSNVDARYAAFKAAKLPPAAQKDFKAACADIDKRIADVKTLVTGGDYLQAKTLGLQALQAVDYNEKKLKKQ